MHRRESVKKLENSEGDGPEKTGHTSMILFFKKGFLIHQVDNMNVIVKIRSSSLPVSSRLDGPCLKGMS
jgi:hypothetical protein